jgi:ABC-type transport system involved in cytochrome bd biosynthesis fused ATPase/permease subunit
MKTIKWLGILCGSATGVFIAWKIYHYNWQYAAVLFIAAVVIITLFVLTVGIINECRNASRKNNRYAKPANLGWNKELEG